MLTARIHISGEEIAVRNLGAIADKLPGAQRNTLERVAKEIHRKAFDNLSGEGAKGEYSAGYWKERKEPVASGGYPVPVRSGTLRSLLYWLKPGESKTAGGLTFEAGEDQAIVYDTAEYADVIHEGRGSSKKFGPRQYLVDALKSFSGGEIDAIANEEINAIL